MLYPLTPVVQGAVAAVYVLASTFTQQVRGTSASVSLQDLPVSLHHGDSSKSLVPEVTLLIAQQSSWQVKTQTVQHNSKQILLNIIKLYFQLSLWGATAIYIHTQIHEYTLQWGTCSSSHYEELQISTFIHIYTLPSWTCSSRI